MTRLSSSALSLAAIAILAAATPAAAEGTVGTLTLDALSFVSFQDEEILPLEPGSTIRFRFGDPQPDGSIPFRITPIDVKIAPIPLPSGGRLHYGLANVASGTVTPTPQGRRIDFEAPVAATLSHPDGTGGTFVYSMPMTTESAEAKSLPGTAEVKVTGMRLASGTWHVQLVGATVNKANAFPKPGTAVYTVLSGQFDQMP